MKFALNLLNYTESELDALPFGIIHLDGNGNILDYNSYEAEISKLKRPEVIGKNFFAHIAPCTDVPEFFGRFAAGLQAGTLNETFTFEFPFKHGNRKVLIHMVGDVHKKGAWIFVADASQVITLRLDDTRTLALWQISGPPDALKSSDA